MGIVDEDIARVREASDIVAIVGEYTQLKKVGVAFSGLCPFHAERSGSFSVAADTGLYHCFGCGVGGDVITFVREKEQLDFVSAVEWLARKCGVEVRYDSPNQGEDRRRRAKLHEALVRAVDWYHDRLLNGADAGPARSYLRQRGYDGEIVRHYRLGWAPDGWDELARALKLPRNDLIDAGLGFVNRAGRQQDAFRGRVLFPIFDAQDQPVGFGGRVLPGVEGEAKYKNSADSKVYAKSRVLYGLNWARPEVVQADEVIVCEGYTDVIGFALAGAGRAVATCGTSLTDEHVKLLRRFARKVVLAFDADTAGQDAAARFYAWERNHDLDVAVADLPPGVDPADLAQDDPERLVAAVTGARPFLEFRIDRAINDVDRSTAEGRARAAELALAVVAEHPNPLVRDEYLMTVASRCRVDVDRLRQMQARGTAPSAANGQSAAGGGGRGDGRRRVVAARRQTPELEALRLAVHRPDEMMELLVPELFDDELYATISHLLGRCATLHEVIDDGGPEVAQVVQRLSVEDSAAEPMDVASRLWQAYLGRQISQCQLDAREPGADIAELNQEMTWFKLQLADLREPERQASTVESLLGWILEDSQEIS